ncbi:heterokaryon incompatibility protein-domain-containing protein, partial [Leptodontidium sp. 2 PMI_412]
MAVIAYQSWTYYYSPRDNDESSQRGTTRTTKTAGANLTGPPNGRYHYSPLPDDRTIRLLRIRPSLSGSKHIHCDILTGRFSQGGHFAGPPYSAISYRWDPEGTRKKKIFINGQPFYVYPKVEEILKYFRPRVSVRFIWIDSVCINQRDKDERESQVTLMWNIYEQCSRVEAWI